MLMLCYDNGICMSVNCIFSHNIPYCLFPGAAHNAIILGKMKEKLKENYSGYFGKIQFVLYSNLMLCIPESLRPENCSIFRKSIFMLTF